MTSGGIPEGVSQSIYVIQISYYLRSVGLINSEFQWLIIERVQTIIDRHDLFRIWKIELELGVKANLIGIISDSDATNEWTNEANGDLDNTWGEGYRQEDSGRHSLVNQSEEELQSI